MQFVTFLTWEYDEISLLQLTEYSAEFSITFNILLIYRTECRVGPFCHQGVSEFDFEVM